MGEDTSSGAEAQLLSSLKKARRTTDARCQGVRRSVDRYRSRAEDLEQLLPESKPQQQRRSPTPKRRPPPDESEEDSGEQSESAVPSRPRRSALTEGTVSQAKYMNCLQRFAEAKSAEAAKLAEDLLRHRSEELALRRELTEMKQMKSNAARIAAEHKQLKEEVARMQSVITDFVIRHREAKASRRTAELQELATIRADAESRRLDLYAFVLSQLRHCVDGPYDIDEESARAAVSKAAAILKASSRPS
jgi:DNA primase